MKMNRMPVCVILLAAALLPGCFGSAVRDEPPVPAFLEGQKYYLAGNYEAAARQFEASISARPSEAAEACYWVGVCRLNQQRYAEAEQAFRRCIEKRPRATLQRKAWAGIGDCQRLSLKYDLAVKSYQRVLQTHDPAIEGDVIMLNCGLCLIDSGRAAEGKKMLEEFRAAYPASPWIQTAKDALAGR